MSASRREAPASSNRRGATLRSLAEGVAAHGARLWRARDFTPGAAPRAAGIGTGFPALDALLAERGWPRAGLTELICSVWGIGELRLLAPALAALSTAEARWIAFVNPPFVPYAPALAAAGIDISLVLLARAAARAEALWTLEQALQSGACGAVLGWPGEIALAQTRRLLLAARQGGAWGCLFRPAGAARQASAAELRLRLTPGTPANSATGTHAAAAQLRVDVLKRRGGWPVDGVTLSIPARPAISDERSATFASPPTQAGRRHTGGASRNSRNHETGAGRRQHRERRQRQ